MKAPKLTRAEWQRRTGGAQSPAEDRRARLAARERGLVSDEPVMTANLKPHLYLNNVLATMTSFRNLKVPAIKGKIAD